MPDTAKKTFYIYFKENMNELGLPAPASLFGSLTAAVSSIGAMSKYVKTFGTTATISEMVGTLAGGSTAAGGGCVGLATALSEVALAFGGLAAAFYVGACIGSLAVATGKYLSGGLSISDCISTANTHGLQTQWLGNYLNMNPSAIVPGKKIRHHLTSSQFTLVPAKHVA